MLADELDYVIGVDTHRDQHVLAVVTAPAGAVVARRAIGARGRGYREALRLAEQLATGKRAWAIAGTGSYGAGLARSLSEHGEAVLEISRTPRTERRLAGRDDSLDAVRIARAALASDKLALPRSGERREALRLLLIDRRSAVDVRREALTQLRTVIVTAPESLRDELRSLPLGRLLDRCSRLRRTTARADELAVRLVSRSLARRVQAATIEANELEHEILAHVRALAPALLDEPGVGPIVAAQLIISWSHPGRLRSRSLLRPPRRRRTHPRLQRLHTTTQAQPRRRPPTQPRPPHHHPPPPPTPPSNPRLHRRPPQRRQTNPRRNPLVEAPPRPPPLPTPRTTTRNHLTGHRSFIPER